MNAKRSWGYRIVVRFLFSVAVAMTALGIGRPAVGGTMDIDLDFSASQSLWEGGSGGERDWSGSFGETAGISYNVRAFTASVSAGVNGSLKVQHPDVLPPDTAASIKLQYLGDLDGGSLDSSFDPGVDVDVFIPCIVPNPFDGCLTPRTIPLLDVGFSLAPGTDFTPTFGSPATASDVDNAVGIGPNVDLIIGELGAEVSVDVAQSIALTPTAIDGLLRYEKRGTSIAGTVPFTLDSALSVELTTDALGIGLWDFALLDLGLDNEFHNDIDLDFRPTINYVVGEWPPPGSPLFSIGLVNETFALDFGALSVVDAFTVQIIPEPGTLLLLGAGLAALGVLGRRSSDERWG